MHDFVKRLLNSRGESLVESMCAILIVTLASVAFLTMVNSSARINKQTTQAEAEYRLEMEAAEERSDAADNPGYSVVVTFRDPAGTYSEDHTVNNVGIATKESGALFAFYSLPQGGAD